MTLLETLEYFIDDQRGRLQDIEWEIREESNYELNSIESLSDEYDFNQELHDNLLKIKSELARLQRYDDELSSVMPEDYKDWWQNSNEEWPEVAKGSIQNLREREELAWKQLEEQQ